MNEANRKADGPGICVEDSDMMGFNFHPRHATRWKYKAHLPAGNVPALFAGGDGNNGGGAR